MGSASEYIRAALLMSGKREFLEHGFEKASLRTICRKAGFTTGAFYSNWHGKEDMFASLVEPTLRAFCRHCGEILNLNRMENYSNGDTELRTIEFMVEHREEFILMFDCSKGTRYEGIREEILNGMMRESYQKHFDFHCGRHVDPELVKILLNMKYAEYMQLLYGNYDVGYLRYLVPKLTGFTEAGFIRLIEEMNGEEGT